jgi:hypothetical protein
MFQFLVKINSIKKFFVMFILEVILISFLVSIYVIPNLANTNLGNLTVPLMIVIALLLSSLIEYVLHRKNEKDASRSWQMVAFVLFVIFSLILILYFFTAVFAYFFGFNFSELNVSSGLDAFGLSIIVWGFFGTVTLVLPTAVYYIVKYLKRHK